MLISIYPFRSLLVLVLLLSTIASALPIYSRAATDRNENGFKLLPRAQNSRSKNRGSSNNPLSSTSMRPGPHDRRPNKGTSESTIGGGPEGSSDNKIEVAITFSTIERKEPVEDPRIRTQIQDFLNTMQTPEYAAKLMWATEAYRPQFPLVFKVAVILGNYHVSEKDGEMHTTVRFFWRAARSPSVIGVVHLYEKGGASFRSRQGKNMPLKMFQISAEHVPAAVDKDKAAGPITVYWK